MTLTQAVGVIMGANVGTAITAWLTALSGIEGGEEALGWLELLKTDSWMPILAVIGICLVMFSKRGKKKDLGAILLGFAVLMVGMGQMSAAVAGLKTNEEFKAILTMFENPILGVLAGTVLTAIVQSSSASIGILQSLTTTGAITYGAAIPIILGQNIGTCVTAMISSIGATKNGRRAALVHLYFNIIGVVFWLSVFYIVNAIVALPFVSATIDMWGVAGVHTIFKILSVLAIAPFYKGLEKLARLTIKDGDDNEVTNRLDERLFQTPAVAANAATEVAYSMADEACAALRDSLSVFDSYDAKLADAIRDSEGKVDTYEDSIGSYLVKLSSYDMAESDSTQVTKLLHIIGDLERISDHAVNIVESAEELNDKKLTFSQEANREVGVLRAAVEEIVGITLTAFKTNDIKLALEVEPLEQVVDELRDKIKLNHVKRLQKNECSIEHGFVLSDLINNFERVSDHCSNIASCVIEISEYDALDMHKYLDMLRSDDNSEYQKKFEAYKAKYALE
jgi:phosphate:Na+ symporter